MNECLFIPLVGSQTKRMIARPVVEIGDRFDVVWAAFAEGPHSNNLDAELCRLSTRLRHTLAIFVAIHHSHIRSHEAKRFAIYFETRTTMTSKLASSRASWHFS